MFFVSVVSRLIYQTVKEAVEGAQAGGDITSPAKAIAYDIQTPTEQA
jgi:hypothetical protein